MKQYNPRQSVELFHLLFLCQLGRKVDKKLYALKSGYNMRFYFKSIRYSEDMDIDIQIINKDTLLKNVKIASPEKALLDIFYLSQTKTRLFKTLPKVELPKNFKISVANRMIEKITSVRKKTLVQRRFSEFINNINVNQKDETD